MNVDLSANEGEILTTPLMIASDGGHLELVRALLRNKAHVNSVNRYGQSALMIATIQGHIDVVRLLLQNEARINCLDWWLSTPLTRAIARGHNDIAGLLMSEGGIYCTDSDVLNGDDGPWQIVGRFPSRIVVLRPGAENLPRHFPGEGFPFIR